MEIDPQMTPEAEEWGINDPTLGQIPVIGYTRVSVKSKLDRGLSLEVQADRIREFAAREGLHLVDIISDNGRSGESLNRPGMKQAFLRLEMGEANGLVVAKLDRLTRRLRDFSGKIMDVFGPDGEDKLYSATEPVELNTPAGRMICHVITAFAECELDTGVERSGGIMAKKKAKGQQLGTIPYGSRLAEDGKTLEPCPEEESRVLLMLIMREKGRTFRAIAQDLDEAQVPTRNGAKWSHSSVQKILKRAGIAPETKT